MRHDLPAARGHRPPRAPWLIIGVLIGIGAEHGVPVVQVALVHTLSKPAVTSLIVEARRDLAKRA